MCVDSGSKEPTKKVAAISVRDECLSESLFKRRQPEYSHAGHNGSADVKFAYHIR